MIVRVGLAPVPVGNGAAVDHEQVVDLVSPAVLVQYRGVRVVAHPGGAVLVRAVARHPLWVDPVDRRGTGRLQDVAVPVDQEPALLRSFSCVVERDPGDGQTPGVGDLVVELDPVVVLRHVVQHHRHRHAVVEELAVDLLGLRAPGRPAGQAPVDRQRDADAGAGDVTAADEASRIVVVVELHRTAH